MIQNIPSKFNPFPVYYNNGGSPEPPGPGPELIPLTFTGKASTNTIQLAKSGSPDPIVLQYKLNDQQWVNYTINDTINLNQGDTVAFSGANNSFSQDWDKLYQFKLTGSIEASGNIQSLMNFSDSCTYYCYYFMFAGQSALTKAPQLPATTLADWCYGGMFRYCSSLTSAPQILPAEILLSGSYNNMFGSCPSLTKAPNILATTLAYRSLHTMFAGCTNLSNIEVAFTNWTQATDATWNWVSNVASNGTFTKPSSLAQEFGTSRIPSGWTVVNK